MLFTQDEETIIAQCTPKGAGAIALLRLSGINVRKIVDSISRLPGNKKISDLNSHTISYGAVIDDSGNTIDTVMFLIMDGPRSFTGQNVIEITCHNNPFIIDAIIAQAIKHGARLAQQGEFTKRAFLNGKIDLLQAEAINELIHANTQITLKQSLAQLKGSFSNWIHTIENELIRTLSWCEASFEFLDDEAEFGAQIKANILKILDHIKEIKKTFNIQQQIRQGIRIALIGSVNAGKSSIFNALLNQKRSIVTNIAGTTRDAIEAGLYKNGNYWTLIDTAGLRQTNDIIEQEGIGKSFEEAQKADIILLIIDGSRALTHEESVVYQEIISKYAHKCILIQNKADLPKCLENSLIKNAAIEFSSTTKLNLDALESLIEQKISKLFSSIESPFLLNNRQYNLLLTLEQKLNNIIEMLQGAIQYELISYHLKDSLETICELCGKSISEAGLDMVFKEFCVGK